MMVIYSKAAGTVVYWVHPTHSTSNEKRGVHDDWVEGLTLEHLVSVSLDIPFQRLLIPRSLQRMAR